MIKVNLDKAKNIAHDVRRAKRAELFAPLDVEATIPAKATQAEAARQAIRDADNEKQVAIDNATSAEELSVLLAK